MSIKHDYESGPRNLFYFALRIGGLALIGGAIVWLIYWTSATDKSVPAHAVHIQLADQ